MKKWNHIILFLLAFSLTLTTFSSAQIQEEEPPLQEEVILVEPQEVPLENSDWEEGFQEAPEWVNKMLESQNLGYQKAKKYRKKTHNVHFVPEELASCKRYVMESTAYCLYGYTASGTYVKSGTVAVDPNVIPLGTKLYVTGYGYATALDTGGAIKGHIVDVWLPTNAECIQWGRRQVEVYVLPD